MQRQVALAAIQRAVVFLLHRYLRGSLLCTRTLCRRVGRRRDAQERVICRLHGWIEDRERLFICEGRSGLLLSRRELFVVFWRRGCRGTLCRLCPGWSASFASVLGRQLLLGHTLRM